MSLLRRHHQRLDIFSTPRNRRRLSSISTGSSSNRASSGEKFEGSPGHIHSIGGCWRRLKIAEKLE